MILALGHECAQALERARLYRAEQDARRRVALLADVRAALSASLDYETTLPRVAELCVPLLGDWVAIDLVRPDSSVRSVGLAHANPAKLATLREYRERFPPDQHRGGSIESIRTGHPVLRPVIAPVDLDPDLDPALRDLVLRLDIRSYRLGSAPRK